MTMSDDLELHSLAGPYVMDAVTPAERERFAEHLAGCPQCRDEVREMREATARLGMAVAIRPRPELREQTIRAAFATSQLAPIPAGPPAGRPGETPEDEAKPRRARSTGPLARRIRNLNFPARVALGAAALVVAALTGFGLVTHDAMQQLHHSQRQAKLIAAVLNAPDAAMLTAQVSTGGTATVVMSHREHCLVITAHDLAPLPGSQAYEIWLMGPAGNRPAGMLKSAAGGMAGPAVVFGLSPGDTIGLTAEPSTGSATPTSILVVTISLAHGPGRSG